jgi:hypothetical protein
MAADECEIEAAPEEGIQRRPEVEVTETREVEEVSPKRIEANPLLIRQSGSCVQSEPSR